MQRALTSRKRLAATALACSTWAGSALAQDLPAPDGQCQLGQWSSSRNLDDLAGHATAGCTLRWRTKLGEALSASLAAHAGWADTGQARSGKASLREAQLDWRQGPWSARLGRQVIAWGRADRINPTDNLAPRDHTGLVATDEAQRRGIDALQLRRELGEHLALVAVLARFRPDLAPEGSLPARRSEVSPTQRRSWAWKLDHSGAVDASLSWFDGHASAARYSAAFWPDGLQFIGQHERQRTLGADFATALQAWTLRGEIARSQWRPDCDGCASPRRHSLQWVLGADRDVGDNLNLNLQFFSTQRSEDNALAMPASVAAALQRLNLAFGPRQRGITLRLAQGLMNERLKLEWASLWDLSHHSQLHRPRISWAQSDALRFGAGLDRFRGPPQSLFGSLQKNNAAFMDMSIVF